MNIGLRVLKRRGAVSLDWVEKFKVIPVACISDVMTRLSAGGPTLRPLHRGGVVCGPAITVKTRPGDNLMTHMALNMAVEGDVIVVDAGGDLTNAIIGERMLAYCVAKKFGGIVVNGAVRDLAWIRQQDFPVYAAGVTHRGPYKDGPGEINVAVSLAGMVIAPGDLVMGDEDGLLSVPREDVESVYRKAAAKHKQERDTFDAIATKPDNNLAAYRAQLEKLGCFFEE